MKSCINTGLVLNQHDQWWGRLTKEADKIAESQHKTVSPEVV